MTDASQNLQPENNDEMPGGLPWRRAWYRILFNQGATLYELENFDEAIPIIRRAAALDQTPSVMALLGRALSDEVWRDIEISGFPPEDEEEKLMEAVKYLRKSLEALPGQFGLNARIGKIYFELGRYFNAADYFEKEYELGSNHRKRPEEFTLYYAVGRWLAQSWRMTGTIGNLKKAEGLYCALSLEASMRGHDSDAEIFDMEFYLMKGEIDSHPDNPPYEPPQPRHA